MEITSDQKRTICAMLAEQAGYRVRSAEIAALCDDETIRAALLVLSSLINVKYPEVSAALAAAQAEQQRNNPQMMMGSPLSDSTLSVPAEIPAFQPDTGHSALPAVTQEPLIAPSAPTEPVITDCPAAVPQSASAEDQAVEEIDRLSLIFGRHAFLTDEPAAPEPAVIRADDPEPDFTFTGPAVTDSLNSSADDNITESVPVYAEPVIINQLSLMTDNKTAEPVFTYTEPAAEMPAAPPADDTAAAFTFAYNEPAVTEAAILPADSITTAPAAETPAAPPADDTSAAFTFAYNEPVVTEAAILPADSITAAPAAEMPVAPPADDTAATFSFVFNEPAVTEAAILPADSITAVPAAEMPVAPPADDTSSAFSFVFNEPAVTGAAILPADSITAVPAAEMPAAPPADNTAAAFSFVFNEPAVTEAAILPADSITAAPAAEMPAAPPADDTAAAFTFAYNEPAVTEAAILPADSITTAPAAETPAAPPADDTSATFSFVFNEPAVTEAAILPADSITTAPAAETPAAPPSDDTAAAFTFAYNEPAVTEAAILPADSITTAPAADDNAGETSPVINSVFSDKSLFPESVAISDPLKNGNWLFDDLDIDDADTPVIGELPEPVQPHAEVTTGSGSNIAEAPLTAEASAGSASDTLRDPGWSFNTDNSTPQQPEPEEYHSSVVAEQKPWGLTALFAAGKETTPSPAAPDTASAENTAPPVNTTPENKAPEAPQLPPGQPAVRIRIAKARLLEPFSSPVTATLNDGRTVSILGIYFQRNIGLSFNDKTGNLHGTPTEYGEFPLRVVWELAPKKRFSSDIHFTVDPGPQSATPAPSGSIPVQ